MGSHYDGTPEEKLALSTYIKLQRAVDSVMARISDGLARTDLTETQFGVLEALYHLGPLHQNEVGKKLLISKSNVVAVIDKLETCGYVSRQRCQEDRRYIFVRLTPLGREHIKALLPGHVASILQAMSVLSTDEQEMLGDLLRKLGLGR